MNLVDYFDNITGSYLFGVDFVSRYLLVFFVNLFNLNVDIFVYLKFCFILFFFEFYKK